MSKLTLTVCSQAFGVSLRSRHLKTDPKAPEWEVAESILLPALDFNLMLLSVTKYGASQIYLPSEVGIYVEEVGKQSILRISCCFDQFIVHG